MNCRRRDGRQRLSNKTVPQSSCVWDADLVLRDVLERNKVPLKQLDKTTPSPMKTSRLAAIGIAIIIVIGAFVWRKFHDADGQREKTKEAEVKAAESELAERAKTERLKTICQTVSDGIKEVSEIFPSHGRTVKELGKILVEQLRPQVTIDQRIVLGETQPTVEVALFSQELAIDYNYTTTWAGSTKEFSIWGKFLAKAGYNLSSKSTVEINVNTKEMKMEAKLPEPELVAFEEVDFKIVRDNDGLWNKLSAQERENAINGLRAKAKDQAKALVTVLKDKTKSQLEKKLVAGDTKEVHIEFRSK